MTNSIELHFDFSSPYAYLASERIDAIAQKHKLSIDWRPFLLGAAFKISEQKPLVDVPLMRGYTINDLNRCAREFDIPFSLPNPFPVGTVNAARSICWLNSKAPEKSLEMIHALFRGYFVEGRNISDIDTVLDIGKEIGIDSKTHSEALHNPEVKQLLKIAVDEAIARGIFGSPCFVVGSEQFWGNDRIDQLDKWLSTGGW